MLKSSQDRTCGYSTKIEEPENGEREESCVNKNFTSGPDEKPEIVEEYCEEIYEVEFIDVDDDLGESKEALLNDSVCSKQPDVDKPGAPSTQPSTFQLPDIKLEDEYIISDSDEPYMDMYSRSPQGEASDQSEIELEATGSKGAPLTHLPIVKSETDYSDTDVDKSYMDVASTSRHTEPSEELQFPTADSLPKIKVEIDCCDSHTSEAVTCKPTTESDYESDNSSSEDSNGKLSKSSDSASAGLSNSRAHPRRWRKRHALGYTEIDDKTMIDYLIAIDGIEAATDLATWTRLVLPGRNSELRSARSMVGYFKRYLINNFAKYTDDPKALEKFHNIQGETAYSEMDNKIMIDYLIDTNRIEKATESFTWMGLQLKQYRGVARRAHSMVAHFKRHLVKHFHRYTDDPVIREKFSKVRCEFEAAEHIKVQKRRKLDVKKKTECSGRCEKREERPYKCRQVEAQDIYNKRKEQDAKPWRWPAVTSSEISQLVRWVPGDPFGTPPKFDN